MPYNNKFQTTSNYSSDDSQHNYNLNSYRITFFTLVLFQGTKSKLYTPSGSSLEVVLRRMLGAKKKSSSAWRGHFGRHCPWLIATRACASFPRPTNRQRRHALLIRIGRSPSWHTRLAAPCKNPPSTEKRSDQVSNHRHPTLGKLH
jgi:hypothetical protein